MPAFQAAAGVFGVMARQFIADDVFQSGIAFAAMINRIRVWLWMVMGMAGRMQLQEHIGGLFAVFVFHVRTPGKDETPLILAGLCLKSEPGI
jgi:hypothetical protein